MNRVTILSMLLAFSMSASAQTGPKIYYSAGWEVFRMNPDGTDAEKVIDYVIRPSDVEVDPTGERLYILNHNGPATIRRTDLNGLNGELLVTDDNVYKFAVAPCQGKIYWADGGDGVIRRANMDGSGVEDVLSGLAGWPYALVLDEAGGMMYWTATNSQEIWKANLNGTSPEKIVSSTAGHPREIALDLSGGQVFWACVGHMAEDPGAVQSANLDGSQMEDVLTGLVNGTRGIDVDPYARRLYVGQEGSAHLISCAFDGSDVQTVSAPGAGEISDIDFVVPEPATLSLLALGGLALLRRKRKKER